MGVIRFLLAFAVVVSHDVTFFGITLTGSIIAVQAFYVISGFYMGLILFDKYSSKKYFLFITNRLLRLLPIYWVLVVLMIISSILWHYLASGGGDLFFEKYFRNSNSLSFSSWVFVIFANLFVIFQDLFLFLGISDTGGLQFVSDFKFADKPLANFLIIPQAWTIGLEIMFYLLVPFIIKLSNKYLILIMVLSMGVRYICYHNGLNFDPWIYRFFPFELLFFMMGILSFRLYLFIAEKKYEIKINTVLFGLMLVYILVYQIIPLQENINKIIFFCFMLVSLPFIFIKFKKNKLDRFIGEFSYPFYLSHVFVITITGILNSKILHFHKQNLDILIIIGSILFSYFLIKLIAFPIEKLRQKRVKLG